MKDLKEQLMEQAEEIKMLKDTVFLKDKKEGERSSSFTDPVRKCIYRLLTYHISFENIGPVIETVLNTIGKKTRCCAESLNYQ